MNKYSIEQLQEKLDSAKVDPTKNAEAINLLTNAISDKISFNEEHSLGENLIDQRYKAEQAGDKAIVDSIDSRLLHEEILNQPQDRYIGNNEYYQPNNNPIKKQEIEDAILQKNIDKETLDDKLLGILDVVSDSVGDTVGDALGGLNALSQPIITRITDTQSPLDDSINRLKKTQEFFDWELKTDAGKRYSKAINETLEPISKTIVNGMETLGDYTLEKTNSPLLAAMAYTAIPGAFEAFGLKGMNIARSVRNNGMNTSKEAITKSAPDIKFLTERKNQTYKILSDYGVEISASDLKSLKDDMFTKAYNMGMDINPKDGNSPKAMNFLNGLDFDILEGGIPLDRMDIIRRRIRDVSNSSSDIESAIGNMFTKEIDSYLDNKGIMMSLQGQDDIGKMYRKARNLQRRIYKYNDIEDIFIRAIEEGEKSPTNIFGQPLPDKPSADYISQNLKTLLKDKDKIKNFTEVEKKSMRDVTQGRGKTNKWLRKIGFFAPFQDQIQAHTAALGSHIGSALIATTLGGTAGAGAYVAIPVIGQTSYMLSRKLMHDDAKFLKSIIASGMDAESITKEYFKIVPKAKRKKEELTELFLKTDLNNEDWAKIKKLSKTNKIINDAYFEAAKLRNSALKYSSILLPAYLNNKEQANNNLGFKHSLPESINARKPNFQHQMTP